MFKFLAPVDAIKFRSTNAYTNLVLATEKYKANPLSRAGNEEVILRMITEDFKDRNKNIYN